MLTEAITSQPSITDWIQAAGVCFASIGLIVTLIFQVKANRAQTQALNRDYRRYIKDNIPKFTVTVFIKADLKSGTLDLYKIENGIYNLTVTSEFDYIKLDEANKYYDDDSSYSYDLSIDASKSLLNQGFDFLPLTIVLNYEDEDGNLYRQSGTAMVKPTGNDEMFEVNLLRPVLQRLTPLKLRLQNRLK